MSYHALLIRFNSSFSLHFVKTLLPPPDPISLCGLCANFAYFAVKALNRQERKDHEVQQAAKLDSYFSSCPRTRKSIFMTHGKLVSLAVAWLRSYGCGVVLSEQSCASGETPDAIGWKRACHSVVVECKISRADFLVDRDKPFRQNAKLAMGCERFYLAPAGLLSGSELPPGWGLLELRGREARLISPSSKDLRSARGFRREMNLLLASLRRVEVRIEPQSITDFLKWKNRMAEYNRGTLPEGIVPAQEEGNCFLEAVDGD